jgi:hypothetical protein
MGKRPAEDELFVGNMGSIQRESRTSMQREDKLTMETGLEQIAAKARSEPKLRFTSLAHHITRERVWTNLCQIPKRSAPGVDGQTVTDAKETFGEWVEPVLRSVHRLGYRAPDIRRVYIPKPGKREKRPLGVPCVNDRALQRSTAQVLSAIYEADFLPCSFGGRPERGAHHALATLNEVIAGGKVSWVLEADLKNFFGSLSHEWVLRFVEHRVGDPRMISLIRRWLKAGILEDGEVYPNEEGTPQGGSISVMLSNVYLHYALDLWFERVVKPRLRGEAHMIRYIDDFVMCFQSRGCPSRPGRLMQTAGKVRPDPGTDQDQTRRIWPVRATACRQTRQEAPRDDLLSGVHALLHAELEGQLQDWNAHREISLAAQSHVVAGPAATNPALVGPGTGQHSQRRAEGPLRLLRHCRKLSFPAKGPSGGRALLAQNAVQPELGRAHHVGHVPPDQTAATDLATKAVPSLSGVTSSRSAVNHLLKSVVREICTLRSVGTGGGRPPPVTR